jgi:hypothetical protein
MIGIYLVETPTILKSNRDERTIAEAGDAFEYEIMRASYV